MQHGQASKQESRTAGKQAGREAGKEGERKERKTGRSKGSIAAGSIGLKKHYGKRAGRVTGHETTSDLRFRFTCAKSYESKRQKNVHVFWSNQQQPPTYFKGADAEHCSLTCAAACLFKLDMPNSKRRPTYLKTNQNPGIPEYIVSMLRDCFLTHMNQSLGVGTFTLNTTPSGTASCRAPHPQRPSMMTRATAAVRNRTSRRLGDSPFRPLKGSLFWHEHLKAL